MAAQQRIGTCLEDEDDSLVGGMSVFYGLFLTMAGFAVSLAPVMIAGPEFATRVHVVTLLFDVYLYVVASSWLLYLFTRILNNATSLRAHRNRKSPPTACINHCVTRAISSLSNGANGGIENTSFELNLNPANLHTLPTADDTQQSANDQTTEKSPEMPSQDKETLECNLPSQLATVISNEANRQSANNQGDASNWEAGVSNATIVRISACLTDTDSCHVRRTALPASSVPALDARAKRISMSHVDAVHLSSSEAASPSFYLRIGAVAFGIGAVTSVVFLILAKAEAPFCCNDMEVWSTVIETLIGLVKVFFLFAQTFFIFKHSKVSILRKQQLARFGQMHLIATNLSDWFETVVQEAVHSSEHQARAAPPSDKTALTSEAMLTDGNFSLADLVSTVTTKAYGEAKCKNPLYELYSDAMAYFSPLIIEYSLIAAVSSYIIYQNVGVGARITVPSLSETMRKVARTRFSVDCSKSIRGLFAGIVALVLSIVVLIISLSHQSYKVILYYSAIDILVIAALIGTVIAFRSIRTLSRSIEASSSHRSMPDAILLMVSLSGVLLSAVFVLIGTLGQPNATLCALEVVWALFTSVQSIAQVFLIFYSESRYCETREEQRSKPGRGAVLFLLLVNFSLWIAHSFVSRDAVINSKAVPLYDSTSYQIVISATLPLLIFFRFHSTACLSEVWRNVYSARRERP